MNVTKMTTFITAATLATLFASNSSASNEQQYVNDSASIVSQKQISQKANTWSFPPVPAENRTSGRNDNMYLAAIGHPTAAEKTSFYQRVSAPIQAIAHKFRVPPSAIIGMAMLESGYGTTRTAYFANNYFGLKLWGVKPAGGFQLIGQPDEDDGRVIRNMVLENLDPKRPKESSNRLIFNEAKRQDNWYYKYAKYEDGVQFLVEKWLSWDIHGRGYGEVIQQYWADIDADYDWRDASLRFVWGLGDKGYCHLGGDYYQNAVGALADQWDLYRFDPNPSLRDW